MQPISRYMTPQPWTVKVDDSLALARQMFTERQIHHLPVLDGRELVGMLTDRDVHLMENRIGVAVEEAMRPVQRVDADDPLDQVVSAMSSNQWNAVVVTEHGRVTGIFTAADALRVLAGLLRQRAA
jgi:acetoin utilization protein AcuB